MTTHMQIRVRGLVTACEKRTNRAGAPVLVVHLADTASGQEVCAKHTYPDATAASHIAANTLARSMHGQVAELDAINPRFRSKRLDCTADHILLPHLQHPTHRKDLE